MGTISAYDKINYSQLKLPTFQEMAMAPAYLTQKHEESQDALASIMSEANKAELLAKESPNGTSSKAYQDYVNQLNEATESLTKKGVNDSNVKSKISTARGTYNKAILPILKAGEDRAKYSQVLTEAKSKDQSLEIAPIDNSVDAWVSRAGQMPAIQGASGEELHKQVATVASTFKSQIEETMPELKQVMGPKGRPLLDEYIYYKSAGYKPQRIAELLGGKISPEKMTELDKQLTKVVDDVMVANNVYGMFAPDSAEAERLKTRASMGLYEAVGGTQMGKFTDEPTRTDRNQRNAALLDVQTYKIKKEIDAEIAGRAAANDLTGYYPSTDIVAINPDTEDAQTALKVFNDAHSTGLWDVVKAVTSIGRGNTDASRAIDFLNKAGITYKNRPATEVKEDISNWIRYNSVAAPSYTIKISESDKLKTIEYLYEKGSLVNEKGEPINIKKGVAKNLLNYDEETMSLKGTNANIEVSPTNQKVYLAGKDGAIFINLDKIDDKNLKQALMQPNIELSKRTGIPFNQVSPTTLASHKLKTVKSRLNTEKSKKEIDTEVNRIISEAVANNAIITETEKQSVQSAVRQAKFKKLEQEYDMELDGINSTTRTPMGKITKSALDRLSTGITYTNPI